MKVVDVRKVSMRGMYHMGNGRWLGEEKWRERSRSIWTMAWKVWFVALVAELFLFFFFKPTAECGRGYYFWLFIVRPSGAQLLVLLGYYLAITRRWKSYSERGLALGAVILFTLLAGIITSVHTSVGLIPITLLLPMLLTPLYKDRLMTVVQAVLLTAVYILDYYYFIPNSPYMPRTNALIEIGIFVATIVGVLVALRLVDDAALKDEERSRRDSLTHLYNHESFYEELKYRQRRFDEYAERFSVAVMDIDDFKRVNDTYGHAFGDGVIREIALACEEYAGKDGFCARYGGEEFAVIFPEMGIEEAVAAAEQIRRRFAGKVFRTGDGEKSFSVSIGVAEYDRAYPSASAFFEKVDEALYRAKREGKNMVKR